MSTAPAGFGGAPATTGGPGGGKLRADVDFVVFVATDFLVQMALHLLNNKRVHQLAGIFAARVLEEAGAEEEKQVRRAYLLAASRPPQKDALESALAGLRALKKKWLAEDKDAEPGTASRRALENFCHALINSASFLYID